MHQGQRAELALDHIVDPRMIDMGVYQKLSKALEVFRIDLYFLNKANDDANPELFE